jgi:hypothetical protein
MHMGGATLPFGHGRVLFAVLTSALAFFQTACIVLPVRIASGIEGVVVDAASGQSVVDALVVVRFDGRYGDVLPDREVLGHREARTDASGGFRVGSLVRPGFSAWPLFKTDARVVAVLKEGYRCAKPLAVRGDGVVKIPLQPALDAGDQRESCRPVPANPGEAEEYMTAWRALFPEEQDAQDVESERQIARILESRSVLGFGENCQGPVTDLALAPDGLRVGYVAVPERPEVRIVEFGPDGPRPSELIVHDESASPRRLVWTSAGDLVLWEPSADAYHSVSPSIFGSDRFEVIWKPPHRRVPPPAAPSFRARHLRTDSRPQHSPLDPADLNDEADARWLRRTFSLNRALDPETGLASDRLGVVREDGSRYEIPLPGEACGPHGRFGRPHYRITATGNAGIDLRFVDGACRAVQIDLETGAWVRLDESSEPATCSSERNVPASHFNNALRSYAREVQLARTTAGGDPAASYALIIGPDGATRVETRSHAGKAVSIHVSDFPLATPLQRINVSLVGGVYKAPLAPPPVRGVDDLEPL